MVTTKIPGNLNQVLSFKPQAPQTLSLLESQTPQKFKSGPGLNFKGLALVLAFNIECFELVANLNLV
jgi:hypothetical protein